MTDRLHFSRRQMIRTALGATAAIVVADRASAVMASGPIGAAEGSTLAQAERLTPPTTTTTTLPPVPAGQIAFPILSPRSCWISDNFGDCRGTNCSRSHEGLDIMGTPGDELIAVVRGRLTKKYIDRGLSSGAGNGWTLYDATTDITYKYFHMQAHTAGLEEGDVVEFGDVIGTLGNTGTSGVNFNTNHHLHFEYRPGDVPRDPRPLLVRIPECTYDG